MTRETEPARKKDDYFQRRTRGWFCHICQAYHSKSIRHVHLKDGRIACEQSMAKRPKG